MKSKITLKGKVFDLLKQHQDNASKIHDVMYVPDLHVEIKSLKYPKFFKAFLFETVKRRTNIAFISILYMLQVSSLALN